jgi:hypothetical protein
VQDIQAIAALARSARDGLAVPIGNGEEAHHAA